MDVMEILDGLCQMPRVIFPMHDPCISVVDRHISDGMGQDVEPTELLITTMRLILELHDRHSKPSPPLRLT